MVMFYIVLERLFIRVGLKHAFVLLNDPWDEIAWSTTASKFEEGHWNLCELISNFKTKQMPHFKHLVSIHCPCSCYTEVILHIETPYCVAFVTFSWFSCFYPQVLSPERGFLNTLTKNSVAERRITV